MILEGEGKKKKRKRTVKRKSGSKAGTKGKSSKQKNAQSKFKKMIALAKKIRKEDKSCKWQDCIKRAAEKMKK